MRPRPGKDWNRMIVTKDAVKEVSPNAEETIHFGREVCGDFQNATSKEWIETNDKAEAMRSAIRAAGGLA